MPRILRSERVRVTGEMYAPTTLLDEEALPTPAGADDEQAHHAAELDEARADGHRRALADTDQELALLQRALQLIEAVDPLQWTQEAQAQAVAAAREQAQAAFAMTPELVGAVLADLLAGMDAPAVRVRVAVDVDMAAVATRSGVEAPALLADPALSAGDVIVEVAGGGIDATLATRIRLTERAFALH